MAFAVLLSAALISCGSDNKDPVAPPPVSGSSNSSSSSSTSGAAGEVKSVDQLITAVENGQFTGESVVGYHEFIKHNSYFSWNKGCEPHKYKGVRKLDDGGNITRSFLGSACGKPVNYSFSDDENLEAL